MDPIEDLLDEIATQGEDASLAIAQCTVRLAESGPILLAVLEHVADHGHATNEQANVAFAALHILGGRRVEQACPAFLRLLRRPWEELDDLLGDAKTETLPLIAAGVFDGDADAFFAAIMDSGVEEYIRFGLFGAVAFLTWGGSIEREATIRFLERFDIDRCAESKNLAWSGWELAISLLGLREMAPQVAAAFRDGRVDTTFGDHDDFIKTLERAEAVPGDIARFEHEHLGYIEDVLAEMERFFPRAEHEFGEDAGDEGNLYKDFAYRPMVPVSNPTRHVGRNDPCPCSSGKKYKKCCLGKTVN